MERRGLLAGAAAALTMPRFAIAKPADERVLRFVPAFDLSALDPVAVNSNTTRNHAYMICDQLYGADATFQPRVIRYKNSVDVDTRIPRLA